MADLEKWPIGATVETHEPLMGRLVDGQDEYGLTTYRTGIVVPVGETGKVIDHLNDDRISVEFKCHHAGHTFAQPEYWLTLVEQPLEWYKAELARLQARVKELEALLQAEKTIY